MAMTRIQARTAIRQATDQDTSDETNAQVTSSQLNTWIDLEYKLLRRELGQIAPSYFSNTSSTTTANSTTGALTMPSDYERLVRVERQVGTAWFPIDVSDGLSPHIGDLNVREEGGALYVAPVTQTAGITFRIVYVPKTTTLSADGDTLTLPDGLEDVVCERVAARVQNRFQRDPSPFLQRAADVLATQKRYLRRRYGASPEPGLRMTRRW